MCLSAYLGITFYYVCMHDLTEFVSLQKRVCFVGLFSFWRKSALSEHRHSIGSLIIISNVVCRRLYFVLSYISNAFWEILVSR